MIKKYFVINERYKAIKRLGVGGMGEVWQCEDLVLGRKVALKFVNEAYSTNNPKSIKVLKDEAMLGAQLIGHPNVVTTLDYGVCKDKSTFATLYYIVMECIEGIDLNTWIDEYIKKFDVETIYNINLFIAWEVCRSINYAHSKGILHRDIKPLNIFLSKMGITKIGDFGIGRFVEEVTRTHTMWQFNTPAYCAPEQWHGKKPTYATDIYQLGCTLYQLFTGKLPYNTDNLPSLMKAHLSDTPVSPNKINPIVCEELSNIIIKAVAKEPDKRVQLWELNDVLAKEIQCKYEILIDVQGKEPDVYKVINKITDFGIEQIKSKPCSYEIPDFSEALSESIQLIIEGVTGIKIHKIVEDAKEEVAATLKI